MRWPACLLRGLELFLGFPQFSHGYAARLSRLVSLDFGNINSSISSSLVRFAFACRFISPSIPSRFWVLMLLVSRSDEPPPTRISYLWGGAFASVARPFFVFLVVCCSFVFLLFGCLLVGGWAVSCSLPFDLSLLRSCSLDLSCRTNSWESACVLVFAGCFDCGIARSLMFPPLRHFPFLANIVRLCFRSLCWCSAAMGGSDFE